MAQQTTVPSDLSSSMSQLEEALLAYDLGTLRQARLFTTGTLQTNLLLTTDRGRYAFRVYGNRSLAYVQFELELLRDLSKAGYPTPAPIPTAAGALTGSFNNRTSAMFTFLEGEHDAGEHGLGQVAAIIGRLHRETAGWELPSGTARDTYDRASCLRTAEHNLHQQNLPDEAARLTWLRDQLDDVRLPAALPRGICHCDPNPTNFLYTDGRLSAVLDFDMAAGAPLIYDVGCLLYWWACPAGQDISLPRARESPCGISGGAPAHGNGATAHLRRPADGHADGGQLVCRR